MKNNTPQLENGYVRISNEIYDKLCNFRMPGQVRQIVDCVVRKTYGYNKKEDWIAQTQIIEMTGMNKGNVSRELKRAVTNKIVIVSDNRLRLNKNLDEWLSFEGNHFNPKKLSSPITNKKVIVNATKVIGSDNKKLSEATVTIDSRQYTKDSYAAAPGKNATKKEKKTWGTPARL